MFCVFFQEQPEHNTADGFATMCDEERVATPFLSEDSWAEDTEVFLQSFRSDISKRHKSFFIAFTCYSQKPCFELKARDFKSAEFADTQPRIIEQPNHCSIALAKRIWRVRMI